MRLILHGKKLAASHSDLELSVSVIPSPLQIMNCSAFEEKSKWDLGTGKHNPDTTILV